MGSGKDGGKWEVEGGGKWRKVGRIEGGGKWREVGGLKRKLPTSDKGVYTQSVDKVVVSAL